MKEVKQTLINHEIETIITAGKDLVKYIKEHPNTLESAITYLTPKNKNYLLLYFSKKGQIKHVKYLVEQSADIHTYDDSALRISAEKGYLDIIKYLVEHGADIHANDDEALRWSAEEGHLDVVKYLVEQGADIDAKGDWVLRVAKKNGHINIVKYLEELINEKH